jgi:flotillin
MAKKADAFAQYSQAAILQMLIERLPDIASSISQPLSKTEKIVVINSTSDPGSGTGATKVAKDVADLLTQMPEVVQSLTGINLVDVLKNLPAVRNAAQGASVQAPPAPQPTEPSPSAPPAA